MQSQIYSIIKGTGCFIPERIVTNEDFLNNIFYDADGKVIEVPNEEIIRKFQKITNISERRYIEDNLVTSDIAYLAAKNCIESSGIDPETLDYVIVAHNFGDVNTDNLRTDIVPSLAARVKHKLGIRNPESVCYDVIFGCPGWLQGVIQANYYIKSGDAKRVLVIGSEALSRISDPHDRDSMIYSDGAGAIILEAAAGNEPFGILSHASRSDTFEEAHFLWMNKSYNPEVTNDTLYLKMYGRKLYEYALLNVPLVVKKSLDRANLTLSDVNKVLIHQANEKMDDAILSRIFSLYKVKDIPERIMPMVINKLGNSSVATIPIMLDMILKGNLVNHEILKDDILVFASVGAGMNINALVYKMA